MNGPVAPGAIVSMRSLPDDLVSKVLWSENVVEKQPEVVACRGVTVNVQRAVVFEKAVQLSQPWSHLYQVSGRWIWAERAREGSYKVRYGRRQRLTQIVERVARFIGPTPSIKEGV